MNNPLQREDFKRHPNPSPLEKGWDGAFFVAYSYLTSIMKKL